MTSTPEVKQEDLDYEVQAEAELRHPITILTFALHRIIGDKDWNEKIAPLLREADAGVKLLEQAAYTRGQVEALEWINKWADAHDPYNTIWPVGFPDAVRNRLAQLNPLTIKNEPDEEFHNI